MLQKLSNLTSAEYIPALLWGMAFTGVSVLVALGKVPTSMLENLLFAMGGAMALKARGQDATPSK